MHAKARDAARRIRTSAARRNKPRSAHLVEAMRKWQLGNLLSMATRALCTYRSRRFVVSTSATPIVSNRDICPRTPYTNDRLCTYLLTYICHLEYTPDTASQTISGSMAMKVVGYIRVSTEEQATSGQSLDAQREKLAAYAKLYDLELVSILEDAGESAKSLNRPGLQDALGRLRRGDATGVLIAKLDRLTRSVADWQALIDE